jgi:hypothetical protein
VAAEATDISASASTASALSHHLERRIGDGYSRLYHDLYAVGVCLPAATAGRKGNTLFFNPEHVFYNLSPAFNDLF